MTDNVDPGAAIIEPKQVRVVILFGPDDDREKVEKLMDRWHDLLVDKYWMSPLMTIDWMRERDGDRGGNNE